MGYVWVFRSMGRETGGMGKWKGIYVDGMEGVGVDGCTYLGRLDARGVCLAHLAFAGHGEDRLS